MSATEELRAMLDERGVEWEDGGKGLTIISAQNGVPRAWEVNTWPSGKDMGDCLWVQSRHPLTPAQAVEATLGCGECRIKPWRMEPDTGFFDCMECDSCGHVMDVSEWSRANYCPNCGRRVANG